MKAGESAWLADKLSETYRVDREIGRGGWGVVYLAEDLRHQRAVAIKVMDPDTAGHVARGRFLREIAVEARLSHPHIVPLFDSGEVDGLPYCVMPYIEGESLQQRIAREQQLPLGDALRIAQQVAGALSYAHAQGVVHRDIKPANILLTGPNAVVADFGIARAINIAITDAERTASGVQLGSPLYMAPEQSAGDPATDGRADIYALGCVLFEMLAGSPPFAASNPAAVMARHAMDPVPPLRTVRPTVSPALEDVVERMLAKVPADRYANADELAAALESVASMESGSGSHARRVERRRSIWRAVALATGAVIVVAIGLGLASRSRRETRAIAAADTTKILVIPFEGPTAQATTAEDELRRAISHWTGVTPVDRFLVRERNVNAPLSAADSRTLAIALGAGRFIRGVVAGEGTEGDVRAVLYDVRRGTEPLLEVNERYSGSPSSRDSAYARVAERLLVRQPVPRSAEGAAVTWSLPARQAYLRGHAAIAQWNLVEAEAALDSAWHADAGFGDAALWLALVRDWAGKPASSWRAVALAAAADSAKLGVRARTMAQAVGAMAGGDVVRACRLWEDLTRRAPFDFAAWYGLARCLDRDHLVLPDAKSPSGWRFRSSYQAALLAYLRAFERLPSTHHVLAEDAFARIRQLLLVGPNQWRSGISSTGQRFAAAPVLSQDTLAFVPYSAGAVSSASVVTTQNPDTRVMVMRRQRELFREVAAAWSAAEPRSGAAREAMALALQLLGSEAALDTLRVAESLAASDAQRRRIAVTRAWMQLKFALPRDPRAIHGVRLLADSLLRTSRTDDDTRMLASLAALLGKTAETQRLVGIAPMSYLRSLPSGAAAAAGQLEVLASFGGPADSLRRLEQLVEGQIAALVPAAEQDDRRAEAVGRAASMAWPDAELRSLTATPWRLDYLLPALAAASRGDTAAMKAAADTIQRLREIWPPAHVSTDALLPEAHLMRRAGRATVAAAWLDAWLGAFRVSQPVYSPTNAALLVRVMVLRADLAAAANDRDTARRWASAVVELWAEADAPLQPTVRRMRRLLTP